MTFEQLRQADAEDRGAYAERSVQHGLFLAAHAHARNDASGARDKPSLAPKRTENGDAMTFIKETPQSIDELVKNANCKHSWKTRLAALEELRKYDCQQSRDVITRLALHDKVYKVKEEAFRAAQALGITKNGNPIRLGKKDIGFKSADFTKLFQRIKREKGMEGLDLAEFKIAFQNLNPEMLDVMFYEKGNKLDAWIESTFKGLPKK